MRYVSEKRLRDYLCRYQSSIDNKADYQQGYSAALGFVLSMAEESPEEKLRPMNDAPLDVPILVDTGRDLREAFVSLHGDEIMVIFSDCSLANSKAFGWRPI